MEEKRDAPLEGLRALDLTDDKGFLCGKILADLGVDVIKIEKPDGDPARDIGPFYHDEPDSEKSLYWFAYNANKRGITLDIESEDGKQLFVKLAKTADFIIESFRPGFMSRLGLGYDFLSKINPKVILVSITAFGQEGPYRDYETSDIVSMAMGGLAYLMGEPDKPPIRFSLPQAFLHAGADAAVGALTALYYRELTGQGQQVDVAVHASLLLATFNAVPFWELNQVILKREGIYRAGLLTNVRQRQLWDCQDGAVIFYLLGDPVASKSNRALSKWIEDEGRASEFMKRMDWDSFDAGREGQETQNELEKCIASFFLTKTKKELYEEALKRSLALCPVSSMKDLLANPQLEARNFWVDVEHEELADVIRYPGPFAQMSLTPVKTRRCAPLIGEHNQEIYLGELGLSPEQLIRLKELSVI